MKRKKQIEFSKKMYIINMISVSLITAISFLIIIFSNKWGVSDYSPITIINTSAWAELAAHTAFFLMKSKSENVIKIAKALEQEKLQISNVKIANEIINGNEVEIENNIPQG